MTPLISFFGWFDIIVVTPFVLYFGYKIIKWIIGKLKKQPQEGEIDTPDVES
jgi:hypothetical protein